MLDKSAGRTLLALMLEVSRCSSASQSVVFLTPRERAEAWIRALAESDPVKAACADAEVEFRRQELRANWRESLRTCDFSQGPLSPRSLPHWRAGAELTSKICLAYGVAAADYIEDPRVYESFLEESVAILSGRTYRQRLQPYDALAGEEAEWAAAAFHRMVLDALGKELGERKLAAWERYRKQIQRKAAGTVGIGASATPVPKPAAVQANGCETGVVRVQRDVLPEDPPQFSSTMANRDCIAAEREARLQEFVRQQKTTITAVCRAANVAKADMQRWRKGEMKSDSVMAQRIEDVLSGTTPVQ